MYLIRLGNEMYDDTYDFILDNFDDVIDLVKLSLNNNHQITIKNIKEGEE